MKKIFTSLLFVLLFINNGCAQIENTKFDGEKLLQRLEILSSDAFEGRKTGEKGNDSARAYIIEQFKSLNVYGLNGNFEHPFSFEVRNKAYNANNILVEIKGTEYPDKYIIISAHHDHLGVSRGEIFNGADDDASGVVALFSFAEYFAKYPPKHSVILAAFDAEEIGLRGANHFLDTMEHSKILLNINMDMISRSTKDELYVVGGRYNKSLKDIISKFNNPTSTALLEGHDGTDGKQNWTMSSDHGPFHVANIPFLYFGNEDHSAYHKPNDDFKDITPEFYKNAVQIIIAVFSDIDMSSL